MKNSLLIAKLFWQTTFKSKIVFALLAVFIGLVVYAAYTSYISYIKQNEIRSTYQKKARESWEANPDKHPHRMAHFGSFAFRIKHPLSMFDNGLDNFTGNAVYLEAHKQNTVNFSEASFSTGLLRFGEVTLSMLLQIILPLILFFLGFASIAQQKENGTLKILLTQGASFKQLIIGNILGLLGIGFLFLLPIFIVSIIVLTAQQNTIANAATTLRFTTIALSYFLYTTIICSIAICVSATSNTNKAALLKLLALWLLLTIVLPKTIQAIGTYIHPAPSKIEFETDVEEALLKQGDSHNPNDPHYKALKDSVLKANKVDSVQQLNFNYSGFQMKEGERLSAKVYQQELQKLNSIYKKQNQISYTAAFFNPAMAVKNLAIGFSSTDFEAYQQFMQQAEAYRYSLAQTMNELQIKHISNKKPLPTDKPQILEKSHWTEFPDFTYQHQSFNTIVKQQYSSLLALLFWAVLTSWFIHFSSRKAKAI